MLCEWIQLKDLKKNAFRCH